jgi:tetratricopeptide (TPR) repeat protein
MSVRRSLRAVAPFFAVLLLGFVGGWYAHRIIALETPIAEAQLAYQQGNFDLAIRLAQLQIQQSNGFHPQASRVLARSLASNKRWAESAKAFTGAVMTSQEDFALHAKALYQLGRFSEAFEVISNGLASFANDPRLLELEARMLASRRLTKEALAAANNLLAIPGKEVAARLIIGMVHYGAQNFDLAADNLKRALVLSPTLDGQTQDFPPTPIDDVNEAIADSLLATSAACEALEYARAAYESRSSTERAVLAAKGAVACKTWVEADKWLERALQQSPDDRNALLMKIDVSLERGALAEAEKALQKLSKLEHNDPSMRHMLKLASARVASARRAAGVQATSRQP